MVAMSYQTLGLPLLIYESKFRENGKCGYLLKPPFMNSGREPREPGIRLLVHVLSVNLIPENRGHGHSDRKQREPFVILTLSGAPNDATEYATNVATFDNLSAVFNQVNCTVAWLFICPPSSRRLPIE